MNTDGQDFWGRQYSAILPPIPPGYVLPLWVAVTVPVDVANGDYRGTATVEVAGVKVVVELSVKIAGA